MTVFLISQTLFHLFHFSYDEFALSIPAEIGSSVLQDITALNNYN